MVDIVLPQIKALIKDFKSQNDIEGWDDDGLALGLHLVNEQKIDHRVALDQSSSGQNGHGIRGWHASGDGKILWIYQSKLTDKKEYALKGREDLLKASEWVSAVLLENRLDRNKIDHALFNLAGYISRNSESIRFIKFVFLTDVDSNFFKSSGEYEKVLKEISKSELNEHMLRRKGACEVDVQLYNFKKVVT